MPRVWRVRPAGVKRAAVPSVVRVQGRPLVVHPLPLDLFHDGPGDPELGQHLLLGLVQRPAPVLGLDEGGEDGPPAVLARQRVVIEHDSPPATRRSAHTSARTMTTIARRPSLVPAGWNRLACSPPTGRYWVTGTRS